MQYNTQIELIKSRGYPAETHKVKTADGYILDLHRIPNGKNKTPADKKNETIHKPAVFLLSGHLLSSAAWIILPSDYGLGIE